MTSSPLDGLDLSALDGYLRSAGIGRDGELTAQLISGGRSNLTFLVSRRRVEVGAAPPAVAWADAVGA